MSFQIKKNNALLMDEHKIKLIITDLDGTLLNGNEEVPYPFFYQLDQLEARGVKVAIASGRQYFNIKNLFNFHAKQLYFIGDNGALAYYQDELFHGTYLPWKKAFELVQYGKTIPHVIPLISASRNTFFEKGNKDTVAFIRRFYRHCVVVDNFLDIETKHEIPLKVAFYDTVGVKENCLKVFDHSIEDVVATPSNVHWLDIAPAHTNKGAALKKLQNMLGISPEETLCFGDYNNDIEMLEASHYNFAVAEAQEKVKQIAKYHCKSNKDEGVIEVIQTLLDHDMRASEALLSNYAKEYCIR